MADNDVEAEGAPPPNIQAEKAATREFRASPLDRCRGAANEGSTAAQHVLGLRLYLQARGHRPADRGPAPPEGRYTQLGDDARLREATAWLRRAAKQGFALSQAMLAAAYIEGKGVKQSAEQAVEWARLAADQGEPGACFAVGRCYERGLGGLNKSLIEALQFYARGADGGSAVAAAACERLMAQPDKIQQALGRTGRSAKSVAAAWAAATDGLGSAEGAAAEKRRAKVKWGAAITSAPTSPPLPTAATTTTTTRQGAEAAAPTPAAAPAPVPAPAPAPAPAFAPYMQDNIATERADTARFFAEPLSACLQHAEGGAAAAQQAMGDRYTLGAGGVAANATQAARWHRKAADQGFARAQLMLGTAYQLGRGLPRSAAEAVKWFRLAAAQGDANALASLAGCLESGAGCAKDEAEALRLYQRGVAGGDAGALAALQRLGVAPGGAAFCRCCGRDAAAVASPSPASSAMAPGAAAAPKPLKACKACLGPHYCGAACQRLDWPRHKAECKAAAAAREAEAAAAAGATAAGSVAAPAPAAGGEAGE